MPHRTTQQTFYRFIPFFEQTFSEVLVNLIDVLDMKYAKFYDKNEGRLDVGMVFKNKEALIEGLKDHLIRYARHEYWVAERSKDKWKVCCKHSNPGQVKCNPAYGIKHVIQTMKEHTGHIIRERCGICLISNCNAGIGNAVYECPDFVPSNGVHRYYLRHVHSNFNIQHKKIVLKDLYWRVGSEYQIRKFNRIMKEIKSQKLSAFEYLDMINKKKWTASHDGGWRCGILMTNMSECINGVLKGAHRLPLTVIAEMTFQRSVYYFRERLAKSYVMLVNNQLWTDFAQEMFKCWYQNSFEHTVTKYHQFQQSISIVTRRHSGHGVNTHVVKIARDWSCAKWTQFGIP
ncbi:UNVERIFIED_CONTAM: hypothetical protein Sindi_1656200 [Sesamum indicum]